MTTYLINHLRIPGGVPKPDALVYLENVEDTFRPTGANGSCSTRRSRSSKEPGRDRWC